MPKYVIEREVPEAGDMTQEDLRDLSQILLQRPQRHGAADTTYQSQVTDDKIYCTYIAPNEEMIREHARQGGFPANKVSEVRSIIDPTTAEA